MLKKSLLLATAAAAAAASVAAPVSAAEVKAAAYADLRYGIDYFDSKPAPSDVNFENHGSYFGVKGSTEQGSLIAFGGYERWLDADSTNFGYDLARQAYAGLRTPYGTVQYGTFGTAYMEAGRKLDPFYGTGAVGIGKPTALFAGGQSHGLSALTSDGNVLTSPVGGAGFVANQLAYTAPTLFGVTANVMVAFDDAAGANAQEDIGGGLEATLWGVTAGVQYLEGNSSTVNTGLPQDTEAYRGYASFTQPRWGVAVSGERIDLNATADDQTYAMASGWFGILDGVRIAASYGMQNETGASEGQSGRLGVFYDVLDNFTANLVYRNFSTKQAGGVDDQVVSLGATYKFELSGSTTTR